VIGYDKNNQNFQRTFKKVFLAAGAVNSTRIILQSKKIYHKDIALLTTIGFIMPLFTLKKHHLNWPNSNTQPGIFFEYKIPTLSDHWVHAQISTANELVLQKLGLVDGEKTWKNYFKQKVVEHLFFAHCNMHSDHGIGHTLRLNATSNLLSSQLNNNTLAIQAITLAKKKLAVLFRHINHYAVSPLAVSEIYATSNHLGGSLPMRLHPVNETDTNILGNPKDWNRIHVIDSSIFPSIPATTIGLLAMANARRIVSQIEL